MIGFEATGLQAFACARAQLGKRIGLAPEALAQEGARLLADPLRARKQVTLGVEHVRSHFPMRAMLDRVEELHETLTRVPAI